MKKCYGPDFATSPNTCPYPTEANTWNSIEDCIKSYHEFLIECDKFDYVPESLFIYLGEPDGDEVHFGYPYFPDFVIEPSKKDPLTPKVRRV